MAPPPRRARYLSALVAKPLPFYDPIRCLLEPRELLANTEATYGQFVCEFSLSSAEQNKLSMIEDDCPKTELQLRFFEVTGDIRGVEQPDAFPPKCVVRINNKVVVLPREILSNKPNVEPKRPSLPVNATEVMLDQHEKETHSMRIEWKSDERVWAVAVYLVSRVNAEILSQRILRSSKFKLRFETTRESIRKRLGGGEDDIEMDTLKITLLCPLMKTRIGIPARSRACSHLQCFDLDSFLMLNEKKPDWKCGVCGAAASYNNLIVDQYFVKMLEKLGSTVTDVQLLPDGSYKEAVEECCDLSPDEEVLEDDSTPARVKLPAAPATRLADEDDVVLLSSDEEMLDDSTPAPAAAPPTAPPAAVSPPAAARAAVAANRLPHRAAGKRHADDAAAAAPPVRRRCRASRAASPPQQPSRAPVADENYIDLSSEDETFAELHRQIAVMAGKFRRPPRAPGAPGPPIDCVTLSDDDETPSSSSSSAAAASSTSASSASTSSSHPARLSHTPLAKLRTFSKGASTSSATVAASVSSNPPALFPQTPLAALRLRSVGASTSSATAAASTSATSSAAAASTSSSTPALFPQTPLAKLRTFSKGASTSSAAVTTPVTPARPSFNQLARTSTPPTQVQSLLRERLRGVMSTPFKAPQPRGGAAGARSPALAFLATPRQPATPMISAARGGVSTSFHTQLAGLNLNSTPNQTPSSSMGASSSPAAASNSATSAAAASTSSDPPARLPQAQHQQQQPTPAVMQKPHKMIARRIVPRVHSSSTLYCISGGAVIATPSQVPTSNGRAAGTGSTVLRTPSSLATPRESSMGASTSSAAVATPATPISNQLANLRICGTPTQSLLARSPLVSSMNASSSSSSSVPVSTAATSAAGSTASTQPANPIDTPSQAQPPQSSILAKLRLEQLRKRQNENGTVPYAQIAVAYGTPTAQPNNGQSGTTSDTPAKGTTANGGAAGDGPSSSQ